MARQQGEELLLLTSEGEFLNSTVQEQQRNIRAFLGFTRREFPEHWFLTGVPGLNPLWSFPIVLGGVFSTYFISMQEAGKEVPGYRG